MTAPNRLMTDSANLHDDCFVEDHYPCNWQHQVIGVNVFMVKQLRNNALDELLELGDQVILVPQY